MSSSKKKKKKAQPVHPEPVAAETASQDSGTPLWKRVLPIALGAAILLGYWYFQERVETGSSAPPKARSAEQILDTLSESKFPNTEKEVIDKLRKLIDAVKDKPSSADAWGLLAMNLDVHDMQSEALACYSKASELNAGDVRWLYYRAILVYEQKPEESLPYFEKAIEIRPNYAAARLRYGRALLASGRREEAKREFLKAAEIEPSNSHPYLELARISLAQGQVQEAGSLLQKAIGTNPRHGEAHGLLSEVFRRLGEQDKANQELSIARQLPKETPIADELEKALMNEGVSSYWHEVRGRAALEAGDYAMAVSELKLAAEAAKDPRYFDTLGAAYLYQNRYAEAAAAHRQALDLNPNSTSTLNNLAAALFELGQRNEALECLKKAIQIDPTLAHSYLHLARLQLRNGHPAGAAEAYRTGLQRIPQDTQIAIQLAWLRATTSESTLRNGAEAVQLAESVARRNPDPETLDVLAAAYAEAGQFDFAVKAAEQALTRARAANAAPLVARIESHLAQLQSRRPIRE